MPSQKEKDVIERQKKLAAAMAAKQRPNSSASITSSSKRPSSSSSKFSAVGSSHVAKTPVTIKAGGLTLSKKPPPPAQQQARPTKHKAVPSSSSNVVDLTKSGAKQTTKADSSTSNKKIMGIHKSFKRPSPAAAMAMARAKAKLTEGGEITEQPPSKRPKTADFKTKQSLGKEDSEIASRNSNRLKSLVQNVVAKKDYPLETAAFAVHITPEDFWKNIRSWDFVTDLARQQLEENNNKKSERRQDLRRPVPDTFINARHYMAIWSPLCLDECRSQLLSEILTDCGQMSRKNSPFLLVDVDTTWKTGKWHERRIHSELTEITDACQVMIKTKSRNDGNKMQFFPHDICCLVTVEKKDLVENFLRGKQRSNSNSSSFDQEAYQKACVVGHTESHRTSVNGLILKVSKRRWAQIGTKEMYLLRIGSNVTALREYTALCQVDLNPLSKFLLGQHLDREKHDSYVKRARQSIKDLDTSDPNHKLKLLKRWEVLRR